MNTSQRDYLLDSAKCLTIVLVVYGHLIEPLIKSSVIIKVIYMSIYSVHMPIFVIISGMLASIKLDKERLLKVVKSTVIPFIAFTIIYELFNLVIFKKFSSYTLNFQPYWILWFLYSLFFWKVFLPIIINFRFPLTISIIISVTVGYFDDVGYFLGISRTIYFFPFFILGYKLKHSPHIFGRLREYPKVLFFAVIVVNIGLFSFISDLPHQWLYGSFSYQRLDANALNAGSARLMLYAISIVSSISLLMLFPRKENMLSIRGNNSLFVFVWHGFFIKFLLGIGVFSLLESVTPLVSLTLLLVLACLLTWFLSINLIAQYSEKLILKPLTYLLLRQKN